MSAESTHLRLGQLIVELKSDRPDESSVIAALYGAAVCERQIADVVITLRRSGSEYWLHLDDESLPARSWDGLIRTLVRKLNRLVLDHETTMTHFHGATVLGRDGFAILMVAESGGGKSTLTACAQLAGYQYLCDELVAVTDAGTISTPCKPLAVRPGGVTIINDYARSIGKLGAITSEELHLAPDRLGPTASGEALRSVGLIVFLRRDGNEPRATRVSPADATVRLINQSMDFERQPREAVQRAAQVSANAACFDLNIGDPAATLALLAELEREAGFRTTGAEIEPLSDHLAAGWAIESHTSAIALPAGVVFSNTETGETCAVNGDIRRADRELLTALAASAFIVPASERIPSP